MLNVNARISNEKIEVLDFPFFLQTTDVPRVVFRADYEFAIIFSKKKKPMAAQYGPYIKKANLVYLKEFLEF